MHVFPDRFHSWCLSCVVAFALVPSVSSGANGTLYFHNVGTNTIGFECWYQYPNGGSWYHFSVSYLTAGENRGVGTLNSDTPIECWQGQAARDGIFYGSGSYTTASGGTVDVMAGGPPVTKYLQQCVKNTTSGVVSAYWKKDGQIVHNVPLQPGQQECYTFTFVGDVELESGYTVLDWAQTDYGQGLVALTNWVGVDDGLAGTNSGVGPVGTNVALVRDREPYTIVSPPRSITFGTNLTDRQARDLGDGAIASAIQEGDDAALAELQRIRAAAEVMTNQLGGLTGTNEIIWPSTNGPGMSLSSAEGSAGSAWEDLDGMEGFVAIPAESAGSPSLTLSIPIRDLTVMNANPLTAWGGVGANVASAARAAFIWFLALWVALSVYSSVEKGVLALAQVPQATTAGSSVLGSNLNLAGALTSAAFICATIAVAVLLAVAYVQGFWPSGNPLAGIKASGTVMATAVAWADAFFPLGVAFVAIVEVYGTKLILMGLFVLKVMVIKFLVGV